MAKQDNDNSISKKPIRLWKRNRLITVSLIAVISGMGIVYAVMASQDVPLAYQIAYCRQPITVDGVVDASEWSHTQQVNPIRVNGTDELTAIRLAYDDHWLYLSVVCHDSQIMPQQEDFWENDSVQFSVSVGRPDTSRAHGFSFRVTPHQLMSARVRRGQSPLMGEVVDISEPLDSSLYQVATAKTDTTWSCELALSWSAIDPSIPAIAEPFSAYLERRNIDGEEIGVFDWPYSTPVVFEFVDSVKR